MLIAATDRCTSELIQGHLPPPCRLLQVGVGSGSTLARLVAAGYAATGITPDAAQLARARARHGDTLPAVCARLENFTGGTGAWDALLFQQSAQHVAPLDLFAQADKLLTERGEIIVLDEFALRRIAPGPESLHLLPHFIALAARFGFTVVEQADLNPQKDADGRCGTFLLRLRRATRPRWRVGPIDGGNAAVMRALFADTFKHTMSETHWNWKYGAGRGHAMGVWREGRLVAHYGGTVRDMLMDGQPIRASQVCDVMVDAAERGILSRSGPLFLAAATFVETYLGYGRPCLLAFGFPNERAWKTPQRLRIYGGATGRVVEVSWACRRGRPRLGSMVRPLDLTMAAQAAATDALWAEMARDLRAAIVGVRDAAWLRYRYLEHPDHEYRLFVVRRRLGSALLGIFVIRPQGEAWELIDVVTPPGRLAFVVEEARRLAAAAGIARLYAWVSDAILPHLGAETQVKELSVIIPANAWTDGPVPETLTGRWWLMGGDSDFR